MKRTIALLLAFCGLAGMPALLAASVPAGVTFTAAPGTAGIVVAEIVPATPAALAGLEPGDHILELDGAPLAGISPEELQNRVHDRLDSDRSALLVYKRGSWKAAAWISPLRLTPVQEAVLTFCNRFRPLHEEAAGIWHEACVAFNSTMKGPGERIAFLNHVEGWREQLRDLGRRGAALRIPAGAKGQSFRDLQAMTLGMPREQTLRNETLALMKDYLENLDLSHREAVFTQMESPYEVFDRQTVGERRWNRMPEMAQKARRSSLRLESLFRKVLEDNDLAGGNLIDPVL